jgi:hypothetical protein
MQALDDAPPIIFVSLNTLAAELERSPREIRRRIVARAEAIEQGADPADPDIFPQPFYMDGGRVFFQRAQIERFKGALIAKGLAPEAAGRATAHRIRGAPQARPPARKARKAAGRPAAAE